MDHERARIHTARYAAVFTAVGCARREVADSLRTWGLDGLQDTAELLASELVANAVTATGDRADHPLSYPELDGLATVLLELRAEDTLLRISVWDRTPAPPVLKDVDFDSEGGRGIYLVDRISRRWGHYEPATGGKVVWCEVVPEGPA